MGNYDADIARYIPGVPKLVFQGILENIDTKEKVANAFYKDMEELDFQILLPDNYYVNTSSIHICFPMKIKKKPTNEATDIDDDLITVNNFFGHLVKEISVTKYASDKELISTILHYEVYQYSDSMLKHLPKDALEKIEKTLLCSKKPVYFNITSLDRRVHNGVGETQTAKKRKIATDLNIQERITKFHDMLSDEHVYRVPLKYFTDIGKINFSVKIDFRFKLNLETDMKKLFESRKVITGAATVDLDTKIISTKAPFIQYEQLLLYKNFRQYLETKMVSKKILRMGTQKSPIQNTCEINVGVDSIEIDLLGSNRPFDWLQLSLVFYFR